MLDRFKTLAGGLKTFMKKTDKTHAVLGLSGGVDSVLTAKIAVEALGAKNVTALLMPNDRLTNPQNVTDASDWARALGIEFIIVPINHFLISYEELPWKPSLLADMNLNARVRATILYHFANAHDAIVLGTGNKTELALGYFTKYGDGACDVEVIGDLYKTDVWAMSKAIGVPKAIVEKIPSAELKESQTDEGEMGLSYPDADAILQAIERGENPMGKAVNKVCAMMRQAAHKTQMPPTLSSAV
ncbi:NAD(+) synthase [Candidatus Peregrinibacteria bacterium]|nr:NAD(+) synthase [Candidatus Peregrinibacteria bacterium]